MKVYSGLASGAWKDPNGLVRQVQKCHYFSGTQEWLKQVYESIADGESSLEIEEAAMQSLGCAPNPGQL